jgi:hypothetical protein
MLDSVCLEILQILMQDRSSVCTKCTIGYKSFWTHLMVLLGDEAQVEARSRPFKDIANPNAR